MKNLNLIIVSAYAIAVLAAFSINQTSSKQFSLKRTEITDTSILRMAIIKSIVNPFRDRDTLVLETNWGLCYDTCCGETLPNVLDLKLDENFYVSALSKKLSIYIIPAKEFYTRCFEIESNYPDSPSLGIVNSLESNKVIATIKAEVSKDDGNILVYESYVLNNSRIDFFKEFFKDHKGKWHFK